MDALAPSHSNEQRRAVLTKALLRVQERLAIKGAQLAAIVGVSPSTVSRLSSTPLRQPKAIELGTLLVRLYRSLIGVVGDDEAARLWLHSKSRYLGAAPIERMQSVTGLVATLEYVDAMRAKT
ncbi:MAG: antitoxin Xre/MbcA/ParS toxin-binding domain-containing protein [Myxococcota bacterium]